MDAFPKVEDCMRIARTGFSKCEDGANRTLLVGHWVEAYKRIKYASLRTAIDYYDCSQCEYNYKLYRKFHLLVTKMAVGVPSLQWEVLHWWEP